MVALLVTLALAGPPKATLEHVPLAVSSWCWGARCGAPIAASAHTVSVARGATVHVALAFDPRSAHVAVAGRSVPVTLAHDELTWRATAAGGVSITATGSRGWVTYVGRIRIRP